MRFGTEAAFADLVAQVRAGRLAKAQWTHEAHFALALWLLRHREEDTGDAAFRALIMAYNEAVGTANSDTGGYHHTITRASLRGACAGLAAAGPEAPLPQVLEELMASPLGRSDWPLAYWSRDVLFGLAARRGWVEPDREPLPF